MYTILKEFGLEPVMVAKNRPNQNLYFLQKNVKLIIINDTFSILNESDYDFIMVNSDKTWGFTRNKIFEEQAFLKFAKHWKIPKFIYGASLGSEYWYFSRSRDESAKILLKNFTGISFREKEVVNFAKKHLDMKSQFVLDPTFIIERHYYLDIIKNYKQNFNFKEKYY